MHLSSWSVAKTTGGQGVHREVESENFVCVKQHVGIDVHGLLP